MAGQTILIGSSWFEGYITRVTSPGEDFQVYLSPGVTTVTGSITSEEVTPYAAFDDFALFEASDPDPAMTYCGWNTAGLETGQTGYERPWAIFYPPLDYPVSGGVNLWNRAAYMAVGFELENVPAGVQQNVTGVQAELMPLAGTNGLDEIPSPSAYQLPRTVEVFVRPTRLNYAPNPDFAVGSSGWTATGSATISSAGVATFHQAGDSVYLTVPGLIYGDQFTASLQAEVGSGIDDIRLTVGHQSSGVPGAGTGDLSPGTYQPVLTFTAPASTVQLYVTPILGSDGTYPVTVDLSQVLVESGEVVGSYFDGSYGAPDYQWGGIPGLSASYWYEDYSPGQVVVNEIVERQVPLSVSAADPSYSVTPTQ